MMVKSTLPKVAAVELKVIVAVQWNVQIAVLIEVLKRTPIVVPLSCIAPVCTLTLDVEIVCRLGRQTHKPSYSKLFCPRESNVGNHSNHKQDTNTNSNLQSSSNTI